MYRIILRLVRAETDGTEIPDDNVNWRLRVRVDPTLRLQATGNYNLLEGITVSDIGSWQGPDADSESTFTGSTLGLVSPGSNTVGGDNSVVVGVNNSTTGDYSFLFGIGNTAFVGQDADAFTDAITSFGLNNTVGTQDVPVTNSAAVSYTHLTLPTICSV